MASITDTIVARGLNATVAMVKRVRRRIQKVVRQHWASSPTELLRLIRRELERTEPLLARVIEHSTLAAWIAGARGPAREALYREPDEELHSWKRHLEPQIALPPSPPFGPFHIVPPGDDPARPLRFPALEAAARDLLSRKAMTTDQYGQLTEEARHTGFTVAHGLTADATQIIQDTVVKSVSQGGGLREFRDDVRGVLAAGGLSEGQVETTYRTQTGLARAAGMRAVLNHVLIRDEFPYVEYFATLDSRVRPEHKALERLGIQGTNVYRADDPVIIRLWPPWAWACRCHCRSITLEDAAARGIREAMLWLRTGEPPVTPTWVDDPGFQRPKGFPVCTGSIRPLAV